MEPDRKIAEKALQDAYKSNPGVWVDHSRYVAEACQNIALHCTDLDRRKHTFMDCFTILDVIRV